MTPKHPKILWSPSDSLKADSNLAAYMSWLHDERGLTFSNYDALWEWSVSDTRAFWQSIYEYFKVISHHPYTAVHSDDLMPDTRWFDGATLNYAEHIFRNQNEQHPAIIFRAEGRNTVEISWRELRDQVAAMASFLKARGVEKGDRVVAFLPNCPEATVGFLAACSLGVIWSSCSPDFGPSSVVDRFQQITPKVLITVDGYRYGGKEFDKRAVVREIVDRLPTLETVVEIPYLQNEKILTKSVSWAEVVRTPFEGLDFTPVDFSDPIWVLYSSGTTGQPKAITHSHGGSLLEHLKYVSFHNDVKPGERYFWFTTTGWMMWNFVQATLLVGATIVLYDGSPGYPDLGVLWQMAQDHQIQHFGTSAPYIVACMKAGLAPGRDFDLKTLRSISSTGSPLPPEGFDWVYEAVKKDLWLCSMSGGTDVCSAFVGGCPLEPVYEGEIQRRALGCAMYAFDDEGKPLVGGVGEMVVTSPMPSMPIYFWNDPDKIRYRESYFEMFPGIWRHGDWLSITERNTLVIHGRSDATLNRHGVRIGTAEIYQSVSMIETIVDSLVVNLELDGGRHFMPLFVVLKEGQALDDQLIKQIGHQLKTDFSPRHIPDTVVMVQDLPYTISGKKMEAPVKKILMGKPVEKAANLGAMRNPESLDFFVTYAKQVPV